MEWVRLTRITVSNVHNFKKIGMDVLKLSIWDRLRLINFIRGKNMGLARKLHDFLIYVLLDNICFDLCINLIS